MKLNYVNQKWLPYPAALGVFFFQCFADGQSDDLRVTTAMLSRCGFVWELLPQTEENKTEKKYLLIICPQNTSVYGTLCIKAIVVTHSKMSRRGNGTLHLWTEIVCAC